ncbi:endoplasmic reticulum membrane sensor NFE2L1a isoform X1 [Pygocentrus nattereri]|uniref:Endoplasmic reticulum membrane sensor NFE2L1 n=1 Tax=Pygocentrus nattereri TaxID=42514 RepID=A0AAR2LXG9_PYGNA|nr:endoplasmic reticulum membrane sensor NFE2L1a isoform X1 [Pygocentrus nattereri]
MQSLKKYFSEGLIQVAILLSLAGIRVDVDPYLPPLSEIIQGQSSALTQTQFHNLWNSLDGHSLHPKSLDLDRFFTTRRLLRWVRSLDHLQVPVAQLETWLVHRESDNSVTAMQGQAGALEGADGLVDIEDSASLTMRMGGGGMSELGYNPVGEENLEDLSRLSRSQMDNEDIKEETDEMPLWQQEPNHNVHQQQLPQEQNQHFGQFNEDEDEFMVDSWRNANPFHNPMGNILGEDVQFAGLEEDTSFSIEECLQLLESNLPLREQQHLGDADVKRVEEDPLQYQRPLLSPLLPQDEPLLDLEQQWQDVLAIMDPEDMDVDDSHFTVGGRASETGHMDNPIHQDTSRHQTDLLRCSQISSASRDISKEDSHQSNHNQNISNASSNIDFHLNDSDIIDFLLSSATDSSANNSQNSNGSSMEEQDLPSLFGPHLEEDMFEEISLLDLALENEFSQSQVSQNVEQDHTDSDSGLSLDFSQSPSSPCRSESSCSSSSSSCSSSSMSSTESAPEEGAIGYTPIKEELTDEEDEGAVGGYNPEQHKMCHTNYRQLSQFQHLPWLEHIGHNHTYNQPQCISQRKFPKQHSNESLEHDVQNKLSSRDEKQARAMKIPFSNDHIINLPVEEFNELLAKHRLSEDQLTLIRDIRRRGKNKMAAQNCRRRKLDILLGLEHNVNGLRRHRARLLREKSEVSRSVREMKQRLNDLYQEVYSLLREEQGMFCSVNDFVMQQGNSSHMSFPTHCSSQSRRKSGKRQKEKE